MKCPYCQTKDSLNVQEIYAQSVKDFPKTIKIYAVCCGECDAILDVLTEAQVKTEK